MPDPRSHGTSDYMLLDVQVFELLVRIYYRAPDFETVLSHDFRFDSPDAARFWGSVLQRFV